MIGIGRSPKRALETSFAIGATKRVFATAPRTAFAKRAQRLPQTTERHRVNSWQSSDGIPSVWLNNIARYHANAITTAEVLEELIRLAKDIRAARARGEETGLSDEEIAFYDALAENDSARQVMGEPALRVIAHELVTVIKGNVSVDWMHRDSARANIRRHVKRLLRKYGYPPDLQDAAVQNVLQQAEALSAEWAA
jgi:type I site-specific restriction-modification system R (restriction) subunit